MKLSYLFTPALAFALIQPAAADAQNPIASGAAMAWQCAPCHGTNGQEFLEAMPPLAGMPAEQFIKAMIAYREGTRPAIIMDRVARGFTDAEIEAMAYWFEKQPVKQWENTSLTESQNAQKSNSTGGQQ
ncbi:cytochrome c [Thiomicrorhabdus sp.]|jgi:sulfide dehydrogenase cytochrome subunit|uniref:c-type cytochrome n=1 Tax=Thiomicrorhabdus sp. TaxID=2039724 RepID=UPI00356AF7E9